MSGIGSHQSSKMIDANQIIQGDTHSVLKTLPDQCVNCCVTSPPYWGLRDYGMDGQQGLEKTPEEYVEKMVRVFSEVKRVLRDDGTLWINLGDSYWGGKGKSSQAWTTEHQDRNTINGGQHQISGKNETRPQDGKHPIIKPKDLVGIPWMVAFALRADGWYLRSDIIWYKRNPMPESVTDRPTKAHEYIFLLSKSHDYYYDAEAIKTPITDNTVLRLSQQIENQAGSDRVPGKTNGNMKAVGPGRNPRKAVDTRGGNQGSEKGIPAIAINGSGVKGNSGYFDAEGNIFGGGKANKKTVWDVPTKPFKEAHFATFPPELIIDCIKAGCPEGGIVLDPYGGAMTTPMVSRKLNRNYIAIELNPKYIEIGERRLHKELGLFK